MMITIRKQERHEHSGTPPSERKTLMQQSPSVPRRALKAVLRLGAVAVALLAFAGAANAAVTVVTPDNGSGTDNLSTAIKAANTSTASSNTLVLEPGTYQIAAANVPLTITKNLNITVDHSLQSANGSPSVQISGAGAQSANTNDWVVNSGVTLTVEGMQFAAMGAPADAGAGVLVNSGGNLVEWGVDNEGPAGFAVNAAAGGTATLNETMIDGSLSDPLSVTGTLTLNNVSVVHGSANGIDVTAGAGLNINNSLLITQVGSECLGGGATNGGPGSISDDATCSVAKNSDTNENSIIPLATSSSGGPTPTIVIPSNPDSTGTGVNCPTVDQRFFPNPVVGGVIQCDVGASSLNAAQQTTAPTCAVASTTAGVSQTVDLSGGASGVGPEAGPGTDNPTNTLATAYPPPAAVTVPGYSISNEQIANGTIAAFTATAPSTSPLAVTASKTTAGTVTHWSFTGLNWAGVARNCF
jgi:hypothetical protein